MTDLNQWTNISTDEWSNTSNREWSNTLIEIIKYIKALFIADNRVYNFISKVRNYFFISKDKP